MREKGKKHTYTQKNFLFYSSKSQSDEDTVNQFLGSIWVCQYISHIENLRGEWVFFLLDSKTEEKPVAKNPDQVGVYIIFLAEQNRLKKELMYVCPRKKIINHTSLPHASGINWMLFYFFHKRLSSHFKMRKLSITKLYLFHVSFSEINKLT